MQKNKIISVWGSPGSGKTTFSIKLAKTLSDMKNNVILVFCDSSIPIMQIVFSYINTENKSLGALLSSAQITQENIIEKCTSIPKNDYMAVMGYLHGENERTYAQYTDDRIVDLLILLKHLADYVVVDCSSYVSKDTLSRIALEMSDKAIRLMGSDLKSLSFFDSTLPMLSMKKYNLQNHIKALSIINNYEIQEHVANQYGGVNYILPYTPEIEKQFMEGALIKPLIEKRSRVYKKLLDDIQVLTTAKESNVSLKKKSKKEAPDND